MDSHFSKLRDSLIEICVMVGMDQDTGLVQTLSPEVSFFEQGLKAFEARLEGALRPGLKGLKALISKAAGKNVPRFFTKVEHGQNSSKLCMPICLYV